MLSENSILLHLPPGMEAKQTVLLDCIRHAAEITWLAYVRLDKDLTWLTDSQDDDVDRREVINSAYMNAWTLVDAIHRFKGLWAKLPRKGGNIPPPGVVAFSSLAEDVTKIRNINDHLEGNLEKIAAHGNPAMGSLSWVAPSISHAGVYWTCMLMMGTAKKSMCEFVNPIGVEPIFGPSGRVAEIHLATGKSRANLSRIIPEMKRRISGLEKDLNKMVSDYGLEGVHAGGDFFIKLPVAAKDLEGSE